MSAALALLTLGLTTLGAQTPPCQPAAYAIDEGALGQVTSRCAEQQLSIGDELRLSPGQVVSFSGVEGERRCAVFGAKPRAYTLGPLSSPLLPAGSSTETCADDNGTWRCEARRRPKRLASGVACSALSSAVASPDRQRAAVGDASPAPELPSALDAASARAPAETWSVFVMNLKAAGVNAGAAALVTDLVTGALDGYPQLDVLSGEDVKKLLQLESDRQAMSCDEGDSCMAELAEALGARLLLRGQVALVDDVLSVDLALVDTVTTTVRARQQAQARDLEDLQRRIRPLVNNLFADVLELQPAPIPEVELGRKMADGGTLLAAGGVGGLTFLGALLIAAVPSLAFAALHNGYASVSGTSAVTDTFTQLEAVPALYYALLFVVFGGPVCGPALVVCAAPVAAGAASWWVDGWSGQEPNAWRAVATAAGAALSAVISVLVAVGIATTLLVGLGFTTGALGSLIVTFGLPWFVIVGAVVGLVVVAGAVAATYDASVGIFGDVPMPSGEIALEAPLAPRSVAVAAVQRF